MNDPHLTQLEQSLKAEVSTLRDGLAAQDQFIAEQNTALRELLAYCNSRQRKPFDRASARETKAYADVYKRLEAILRNSTVVATEVDPSTGLDL